jgi:hypothetical protein
MTQRININADFMISVSDEITTGFYIEVACQQRNHHGERICGDVFLSKRIPEEKRVIAILSDGMGHGVKANILATLTSTMAMRFTIEHEDPNTIAEIIMNTLPVCSERNLSYSTFTIVNIEFDGTTQILEYGNPECLIFRGNKVYEPGWQCIILTSSKNAGKEIRMCTFKSQREDRIIFYSDGVFQSGTGTVKYPTGWGMANIINHIAKTLNADSAISAKKLAGKVVKQAFQNDNYEARDDISCTTVYLRLPRRLLVCSGPPFEEFSDADMASLVKDFEGKKVICGATTSDIVAHQLGIKIIEGQEFEDPDLPPVSFMAGIDLVTEGILTLSKVSNILKEYSPIMPAGKGPAYQIINMLLDSDEIHFLVGTRINPAHHDPKIPRELEIRRTVINRIARILEEKFMKEVYVKFM